MSSSDILSDQWDKRTGSLDSSINFVPYLGPGGGTVSKSVPRAPPLGSPGRDGARRGALKGSASLGYSRFQGAAGGGVAAGGRGRSARAKRGRPGAGKSQTEFWASHKASSVGVSGGGCPL